MTISPNNISPHRQVVGLLPATGRASGFGPLPCSKEILPVRIAEEDGDDASTEVVSASVLRLMAGAGIDHTVFLIDREKLDIAAYWGSGSRAGLSLAYHPVDGAASIVHAVAASRPFVRDRTVAFGYPDVIYHAPQMYERLIEKQEASGADVVLALFPACDPSREDTVNVSRDGVVREIRVRSATSPFEWAWAAAVWTPAFTELIDATANPKREHGAGRAEHIHLGDLMNHAQRKGMTLDSVDFSDGRFMEVATPPDWHRILVNPRDEREHEPVQKLKDSSIPSVRTLRQP